MKDSAPFISAACFLLIVGFFAWLISSFSGCGGDMEPVSYCAGVLTESIVDGPVQPSNAQIINSTPSTDRRGTVQVYNKRGSCTGTVIGPHTVLTAAHCSEGAGGVAIDLEDTRVSYPVADIAVHPDYTIFPYDDIALFYVEGTLPEPYVELYDFSLHQDSCIGFLVQGYGVGSGGLAEKPYIVRHVGGRLLLTQGKDGSACSGDSGGPLYAIDSDGTYRLAGSLSTGHDDICYAGGHHVRLDYYADWIEENTR